MTEDDPATTGGEPPLPDPQQDSVIDPASALDGLDPAALLAQAASSGPAPTPTGRWMPPPLEEISGLLTGYQITALLGRGGMGAVYRGLQVSLDRQVAIKLLPPELGIDPEFEARFKREAKSMAKLNHSNIVQIYDFGQTTAGHYYFVMEYVDGCDLHQLIRDGLLDVEGALNAVSQICDALQYAHDMGFVHRDIKPANIFINQQGILKVGDFGLAKLVGGDDAGHDNDLAGLTGSGIALGTMHYIAPEQLAEGMVDRRADIYSLGVMFYQMLTRELPRGAVKEPSKRVAMLDVRIDGVVFKAMDPDPDDRYQSAADFRTDVDRIRLTPPAGTEPAGEKIQSGPTASGNSDRGSGRRAAGRRILVRPPEPAAKRGPRRNGGARVMTVFAGLAIIGGLAWWVSSQTVKTTEMEGEAALGFQPTERLISVETTPLESVPVAEEPIVVSKLPVSGAKEHPPEAAPPVPTKPTITITATKDAPFVNSLGMKFVPVPGTDIYMCIHETRKRDYAAYARDDTRLDMSWKKTTMGKSPIGMTEDHPVTSISWLDAQGFCEWLSHSEGLTYRLPTDYEWTVVSGFGELEGPGATPSQLGVSRIWGYLPFGKRDDSEAGGVGNYGDIMWEEAFLMNSKSANGKSDGFATTAPVMSYRPNPLGIFDLKGNVWEFCMDPYDESGLTYAMRGASFSDRQPTWGQRGSRPPDLRTPGNGFRVVLEAGKGKKTSPDLAEVNWIDAPERLGNSRYQFVRGPISWGQARILAEKSGGYPAVITSLEEQEWVASHYGKFLEKSGDAIWLGGGGPLWGGSDPNSQWDWLGDETVSYEAWLPGVRSSYSKDEPMPERPLFISLVRSAEGKIGWEPRFSDPGQSIGFLVEWSDSTGSPLPTALKATPANPFRNSLGMDFMPLPGTSIQLCIHETRKQDYAAFAADNPGIDSSWKNNPAYEGVPVSPGDDHPVVMVNWLEAREFCSWLSKKEGHIYRLPTDQEWSQAVGLDTEATGSPFRKALNVTDQWPWGKDWPPPPMAGNFADETHREKFSLKSYNTYLPGYRDGFVTTSPVREFTPNALGFHDLAGNVWEWCEDIWSDSPNQRTLRGGSWSDNARFRSADRTNDQIGSRRHNFGFRCAVVMGSVPAESFPGAVSRPDLLGRWYQTFDGNPNLYYITDFTPDGKVTAFTTDGKRSTATWQITAVTLRIDWDNGVRYVIPLLMSGDMRALSGNALRPGEVAPSSTVQLTREIPSQTGAEKTEVAEGFASLFQNNSTAGWEVHGPGAMDVKNGVVTMRRTGNGNSYLRYTKKSYKDFHLRVEFQITKPGANSGIFVRFPDPNAGSKANVESRAYQIDVSDLPGGMEATGAICFVKPPSSVPQKSGWNELDVEVRGHHYLVKLNGVEVNDFTGGRELSGYIGLQIYKPDGMQFRNMRVKEL